MDSDSFPQRGTPMNDDSETGSHSLSVRQGRSLALRQNSLVTRGLQDLATLIKSPSLSPALAGDIHAAAAEGNVEAIRRILDICPESVNAKDNYEWTPLHFAVCHGHSNAVALLLARGADVEARLTEGTGRIQREHFRILNTAQSIIDQCGDNINFTKMSRFTALHIAAWLSRDSCAEHLVAAGADVAATDKRGCQALHLVAGGVHCSSALHVARLLLANGADIRARNRYGETPLHMATGQSDEFIQHLIESGADVDARDLDGETPLHRAALNGASTSTEILLRHGASPDAVRGASDQLDWHRATPARLVTNNANMYGTQIQALLEYGASVDQVDEIGRSLLHWAAQSGVAVELLLERGIHVNVRDRDGYTPLHAAACSEYPRGDVVDLLIQHGAKVNARDHFGQTPLDCAMLGCMDTEVIDRIREYGGVGHAVPLGICPDTHKPVFLRTGRDGWCVQLGQAFQEPKVVYAPISVPATKLAFEDARRLLSLAGSDQVGILDGRFRATEQAFRKATRRHDRGPTMDI